ncbi:MAG: cellulase family glycosylhydrolase [Clostridia bacterium]|nr:cellulase family glycosylhydrolase [Clostridia bacterium]
MKNKGFLSIILVIVMLLSVCFVAYPIADAEYMKDITAFDLISQIKVGINIGNSFDSVGSNETSWGNPRITKQLIKKYKELGFDTIRLPVTWRGHMDSSGYPDIAWLDRVQEVVDWILEEDLYCIINTHHEQNWLNTNSSGMEMRETKFKNLWTDIATRFRFYDERLMFEAYNEILKKEKDWSPAEEIDYQNANTLSQAFVDAVRVTGGNNDKRILIINTYGAIREVYGFSLPRDTVPNKLAVQFHSYDPQGFCFAGSQSTWNSQNGGIIDSYCRLFYENYVSKGTPVILGEFGAADKSNESDRATYAEIVAKNCVKYGIKPIWWDNGGDFKLVDRNNYDTLFPQIVSALVDNSSKGIFPSATTYTNITTAYESYSSLETTATTTTITKTRPSTTIPDINVDSIKNVSLNLYGQGIDLSWSTVSGADFYRVYKSLNNGEFKIITTTSANCYFDDDCSANNVYKYKITACKKYADYVFESEFSEIVSNIENTQRNIATTSCLHTTVVKYKKVPTYFEKGYSGDTVCLKCEDLILKGKTISKLKLTNQKFNIKKVSNKIKIIYKKVNDATNFQVRYRIKGKWIVKKFKTKKNVTKTLKALKKGTYKVQARVMFVRSGKTVYSSWTKVKKIKIK